MEGSNGRVKSVLKGRRLNSGSQSNRIRCTDIESLMEYDDSVEPVYGYADTEPTAKPRDRKRTQPRQLGRKAWSEQN